MKRSVCVLLAIMMFFGLLPHVSGASTPPIDLDAPQNLSAVLKYDEEGVPYFDLTLNVPNTVQNINDDLNADSECYDGFSCDPVVVKFEYRYGSYDWNEGPSEYWNTDEDLSQFMDRGHFEYRPFGEEDEDSIDIKAETYQFRACFSVSWGYADGWMDKEITSGYSNIVTIGNPGYSARLSGANRRLTAIAVSKEGWPTGADAVILTREDNYPDALTGTPLSRKLDAPILFTNSKTLNADTEAEIARLNVNKVIILGGSAAVSDAIETKLRQRYTIQRIGGKDRYETAKKIALELGYQGQAVVTTGTDFHDALIVSPLAAYNNIPILLTMPNSLPQFTKDALEYINPTGITVVGNTTSVSASVFTQLQNAERVCGGDIYETSVLVARHFEADPGRILLATGKAFPDALSGSGLGAKYNSPILFVGEPLSSHVKQYLSENKGGNPTIHLLGGEAAISQQIKGEVDKIFE